jgi:hypothetical protein
LVYRAPKNYQPGGADAMAAWSNWFEEMGARVVERGNPVFDRTTLGNGVSDTVLGGYSVVTADDLESAVGLAKGCPFLGSGGGVEVGELTFLA